MAARSSPQGNSGEPAAPGRPAPSLDREPRSGSRRLPPQERPEETVSITPAHTPRRLKSSRRRQTPPPAFPEPELRTEPVRALGSGEDVFPGDLDGTALGDDDAHVNTQQGHPPPRRGTWIAVVTVLLLLSGGAATVVLGLDGGRISSWAKPRLGMAPKESPPATAPPPQATASANPPTTPTVDPVTVVDTANPDLAPGTEDAEAAPTGTQELEAVQKKPAKFAKRPRDTSPRKTGADGAASETAQAAEPGLLTLVTEPPAKVFLGARELGTSPLVKVSVPSGEQVLKLVDGDGKELKLPVDIKPGETTSLRIPLRMLSPQ